MNVKALVPGIRYLPASEEPLSADVFLIEGAAHMYVMDVGSCDAAYELLKAQEKPLVVILSHFHADHTANMARLTPEELYTGTLTAKKVGGTVVRDAVQLEDGVRLEIRHCPSPHVNGSLILTVNNTYTLLGDLVFFRSDNYERGEAMHMLQVLEKLDTKYFICSHQDGKVQEKAKFLEVLRRLFDQKSKS